MARMLRSLFTSKKGQPVIIVSGLPRSGTSMMMQILEAGGVEAMTDYIRSADDDNPKGYYEFERVKKLQEGDFDWLDQAHGKVVKIIATLLPYLPTHHQYLVVFMRRNLKEILASQKKMLQNRGKEPDKIADEEMSTLFEKHLRRVDNWIEKQPNVMCIDIDYNNLVRNPGPIISEINRFFGNTLDTEKMTQVIDPSLYRQRLDN